jgi:ribonuclease M5
VEKARLKYPIIVEGKYDKNTLSQIFDGTIISVGGFSVFNSKEKQALIRKMARDGIILLTDSDGGGRQIRSFLQGILPPDRIYNAYIPKIEGKEKRKQKASASGLVGVEGMSREVLLKALAPFIEDGGRVTKNTVNSSKMITKVDFYEDGLAGGDNSSAKRAELCKVFDLPCDMTAKALLEALNLLFDYDTYKSALEKLDVKDIPHGD